MKLKAVGVIELPHVQLEPDSGTSYTAPPGVSVTLEPQRESDVLSKLLVSISLDADDLESAWNQADYEVSRLCDLFSVLLNLGNLRYRIDGVEFQRNENGVLMGHRVKVTTARATVVVPLGKDAVGGVALQAASGTDSDYEEVMSAWRQAVGAQSPVEKFYALYRLMERLLVNAKGIEDWVKDRDPSVRKMPKNKYRDYEHTIYTYLRDNVHYKAERKTLPVREIRENVEGFQRLVRLCIAEKLGVTLLR